jgi:phage terminase large subunit-like protein
MARSTAKTPWRAQKWGAAPAIGSAAEKRKILELLKAVQRGRDTNKLKELYSKRMTDLEFAACCRYELEPDGRPYPWQVEFHNQGAIKQHRAVIANNQGGKTRSCGAELACHVTGWYPDWWEGKRFDRPTQWTVGSNTNESLRNPLQKELYGGFEPETKIPDGTGWIPKDSISSVTFRQCGLAGVLDEVMIKHVSGGLSSIKHKTYAQGSLTWQGTKSDGYWLDEEPENDDDIFSEVQRGMLVLGGILLFSRTPLFGMTKIVRYFMEEGNKNTWYKNVTIQDSPHITKQQRDNFIASLADHEIECRTKGIPMLGEGAIYPIGDDKIKVEPFQIPSFYKRIVGMDFGHTDHPTAAVWLAYDPDADVCYVTDVYKRGGKTMTIAEHANAIHKRGFWIPVAWPHDGMQGDRSGSGLNLMQNYKACHLNMLHQSARYVDDKGGGQAREPIIQECYERMVGGRLRVFSNLAQWFEEKRMYHRKDGKVVDLNDDLLSATHYAVMMRRYAKSSYITRNQSVAIDENPLMEFGSEKDRNVVNSGKNRQYTYV